MMKSNLSKSKNTSSKLPVANLLDDLYGQERFTPQAQICKPKTQSNGNGHNGNSSNGNGHKHEDAPEGIVFYTYDYGKFKHIEGNRQLDQGNCRKLLASMKRNDSKVPIIVTKDFHVIDGQHRLFVRKQLLLPVYYIVSDMSADANSIINTTRAQKPDRKSVV